MKSHYEVVLIGSDSEETIQWTHAHYFGRSADDLDPHGVIAELDDIFEFVGQSI